MKSKRCGKSVRALSSFDCELEDGTSGIMDEASKLDYSVQIDPEEYEYRCSLAKRVVNEVFEKYNVSDKCRDVFNDCVVEGLPPAVVSVRRNVTINHICVIVCRCKKMLGKYGSKLYRRLYDEVA